MPVFADGQNEEDQVVAGVGRDIESHGEYHVKPKSESVGEWKEGGRKLLQERVLLESSCAMSFL